MTRIYKRMQNAPWQTVRIDQEDKVMAGEKNNVVIVLYQYSIVAKGIEKKITESGYNVEVIEDFNRIGSLASKTDLFVINLPEDITDNNVKLEKLKKACGEIDDAGIKKLFIGESTFRIKLISLLPAVKNGVWLDRPVDMNALGDVVKNAISEEGNKDAEKRILIIDDDPSYAGMVREWIKDIYRTDIVTAGMQAIKFLLKHPVDLILLDYEMPVVDGPQVLQMLRQEEATQNIPVIFLTGIGTKEAVQRVMSLKPDGYMLKSTSRENLIKFLKDKLG